MPTLSESLLILVPVALAIAHPAHHASQRTARQTDPNTHTMIPATCFSSQTAFDTDFDYLYPWGTDHNGAARMAQSQVSLANNMLTLTATPASDEPDASFENKPLPIHYLSGAVHAKETFTVAPSGGYDFRASFRAPVATGTWPAFWLTGTDSWPPEIDMAEWKGSGDISFNTFNTSSEVAAMDVEYSDPDAWHDVLVQVRDANGEDVSVVYTMDGAVQTTQWGKGFVGEGMWLVINLQMEGSSGSPGPDGDTVFQIRDLEVLSYNPMS